MAKKVKLIKGITDKKDGSASDRGIAPYPSLAPRGIGSSYALAVEDIKAQAKAVKEASALGKTTDVELNLDRAMVHRYKKSK